MAVLCDVENWVTWAQVAPTSSKLHNDPDMPPADTTYADLPARWQAVVRFAAEFMYVRTGAIYSGPCPWRYEPTPDQWGRCSTCHDEHYPIVGIHEWRRTGTCPGRAVLELGPAPVREIVEVIVDDEVIDPSGYDLVNRRWLARVPSGSWPAPPTAWGDTSTRLRVDYVAGPGVPAIFGDAAAMLAAELAADEAAGKSKLPAYWQTITRDGFTITRRGVELAEIEQALTGISPLIDQALAMAGPQGHRPERSEVAVPGMRQPVWLAR